MEIRNKPEIDVCFFPTREARIELSRPYGKLVVGKESLPAEVAGRKVITVGDFVTKVLNDAEVNPYLSIIDGKTMRNLYFGTKAEGDVVVNEAGVLRLSSMLKVKERIETGGGRIFVNGEEDMLAIPAILFSEDGDVVVYGQPKAGSVVVKVNRMIKWRVNDIFSKFLRRDCQPCAGSSHF
ncbi:GTP-dependent dephospho-CoA kinase family protein [Sulfuracidifex tepidarius]|uniref:GTP-dependent dephospho-CoA kinase n=1 Tax=Sulfuracidifex tepidarius TaxID=1294262 RepID=A0A510DVK1_9CREN|nr:DUF359 domain-containing protein [Sulfuracidifex tepidarius]BBG24204.1 hypothetical protein IC006_1511 [Sulfuracidifex tepidarius]BBG26961.1 hypothetical protein IC007_1488 [Sulfuracidifex tepidarius]